MLQKEEQSFIHAHEHSIKFYTVTLKTVNTWLKKQNFSHNTYVKTMTYKYCDDNTRLISRHNMQKTVDMIFDGGLTV